MRAGRQFLPAVLAALLVAVQLGAQQPVGTVVGRVVDAATGEPLAGVTVSTAQRSTVSGPDGRFTLARVPAGAQTVRAVRVGYGEATRRVEVDAGRTVEVELALAPGAVRLEEMVVIGYGERRTREVAGAVESVSADEFNTGRIVSPEQLIQGKVAGVQVVDTGEPGGGSSIRIRGGTSVNASNEPLIVVDGFPLQPGGGLSAGRNPLNFINPNDIASVTVLKDAASTAIYGSRGANGVILIETRSGREPGPSFSYASSFSTSTVTRAPELLDAQQFRTVVAERAPHLTQVLGTGNTDWRREVQRDAVGQEHSVALAGMEGKMDYRLTFNYLDQQGVIRGSDTERVAGAVSFNHRLFADRLSLSANLRGSRTRDAFTPGGVLGSATVFDPTQPVRNPSGSFFEQTDFQLAPNNPVAELALVREDGTTYRSIGTIEGRYRTPFLEGLSTTLRVGYDAASSERRGFWPSSLQAQLENPVDCEREADDPPCPTGTVNRSTPREVTGLVEAFANYVARPHASGALDATLGYSYEATEGQRPYFYARGLATDLLGPNGIPVAAENASSIWVDENRLASFFGRMNYTLADRYILMLSVRRDGSSRFAPGNQWGTFPAAALAWRISDESALDGAAWLSDLKLRASWGVNGNQAIGNYLWVANYRLGDAFSQAQFGNDFVTTIRPTAVDPEIRWEKTTSYNLGFDYGLLDDRISGSVEYYLKDTDDLLFSVPVAAGTFVSNYVTTNVGSVRNQGVELSINARVLGAGDGGLTWDASLNAASNRNRLLRVNPFGGGGEQILVGGIMGGVGSTVQVLQPQSPVNAFFLYEHRRDAQGRPVATGTDLEMYVDLNGDGRIGREDRRTFRSPTPRWMLGHSSQLAWRGADLSFSLRAHLGNHVYNNLASAQGFYDVITGAGGPVNLHASVLENRFESAQYFSDVYVEDASFLRMDNLTLGYRFPAVRGVEALRVFGTVQNVFTLTGYSGVDPEAGLGGIDFTIYPRARTFTAGLSVGF